jgi:hypothetical protein
MKTFVSEGEVSLLPVPGAVQGRPWFAVTVHPPSWPATPLTSRSKLLKRPVDRPNCVLVVSPHA